MIAQLTAADLIRPSEKKLARLYDVFLVLGGSVLIALCTQVAIGYPVEVLSGELDAPVGKPFYSQGGGWRAPLDIMEAAFEAGTNTLFVTQAPLEYVTLANSYGVNLVSVPHDMLDSRGMRLLYDQVFEQEIRIIPCSNYHHLDY